MRKGDHMKNVRKGHRVVVTGLGTVNSVGNNVKEFWQGLLAGKSGTGRIAQFDASGLSCQVAGEVKGFDPLDFIDRKEARHMARFAQFAIAASRMAVEDAALDLAKENPERMGIYLGKRMG